MDVLRAPSGLDNLVRCQPCLEMHSPIRALSSNLSPWFYFVLFCVFFVCVDESLYL